MFDIYTDMSVRIPNEKLRELFHGLAREEAHHLSLEREILSMLTS